MIKTFDMILWFRGYERYYHNISRTAVNYYVDYHKENPDYQAHAVIVSNLLK